MKSVNLLPERQRPGLTGVGSRRHLAAMGAVLAIGGLGYYTWSLHQDVSTVSDQVAAAAAERDALQTQVQGLRLASAQSGSVDAQRGVVTSLAQGRVNYERLVRDLVTTMPRSMSLTNLKATVPTTAAGATPTDETGSVGAPTAFHLDGFAPTQRHVALLMVRMRSIRGLGEPYLTTSEAQGGSVHFVIDAPIDQRAQDRPTVTPVASPGVTP